MPADHDRCQSRIIHQERVEAARSELLSRRTTHDAADLFKAMGDPTRLTILWALKQQEMCVCDLAALLGLTDSAISHQLKLLRTLRLVENRRQGVVLYYRLSDDHVEQLLAVALEHLAEQTP